GSNVATDAISSALDLPFADAENMKRRLGEVGTELRSAERAVQATIEELVGEIRNSIQYFATLPGRSPIVEVTVTGAGAQLRGLVDQLQSQVRMPVKFVSPLSRLDLSGFDLSADQVASIEPVLAAPIGLALPEPNSAVREFNLVPPEVLERERQKRLLRYSVVAAAGAVVLLAGLSVWRYLQVHSAENDVSSLQTSVAALNAQIPKYSTVVRAQNDLKVASGEIAGLDGSAINWPAVLAELQARTPQGLSLSSFTGTTQSGSGAASSASSPGASNAGAVGSLNIGVSGTFPATAHFSPVAEWIDSITGSSMFDPPSVSGVSNAPVPGGTSVTFQSTVSLTSGALVKKANS
ncbi:MAG: pilus assembly protein PilM, partial [Nitrososphaerales archaeon]